MSGVHWLGVHWLIHSPSPYMADLFRSLGPDLTVHFRYSGAGDRPWREPLTTGYRSRIFKRFLGIDWHFVRLIAARRDARFVLCSWDDPTELLAILVARLLGRFYMLWTDTPFVARKRSWWKERVRDRVLHFAFNGARAVMGTGTPAIRVLREMGCPAGKLVNFPYFIDLENYRMRVPCECPTRFVSCGRLVKEKNFDLALRALAQWGRPFVYRIAGTGPELEALREVAKEVSIADRVEFPGWLEPAAVREIYRHSDVLLHPARFEPYGVCVLEAMASGLVVIGSEGTAAAEDRILDGVNGFIHRTGDVEDLVAKIQSIHAGMGLAARKTAEEWPMARAREILSSTGIFEAGP